MHGLQRSAQMASNGTLCEVFATGFLSSMSLLRDHLVTRIAELQNSMSGKRSGIDAVDLTPLFSFGNP